MNRFFRRTALVCAAVSFAVSLSYGAGNAGQPNICVRSCWGARAPNAGISQMAALTRAIVHHTAGSEFNTVSLADSQSRMRAIQNYHMDTQGWGDIGYHFLIDKFGNIFEGRSGSMSSLPRGAHDAANTNSVGFTFMGYFHPNVNNSPTAAMLNSAYNVIAWRMPNGWSPYGSPGGTYGNLGNTVGRLDAHRRVVATACPGDLLFNPYIGTNLNAGTMRNEINARIVGGPPPGGTPVTGLAGWYRIVTQFGGKVFDVTGSGTADGDNIQQYTWNGSGAQVFLFEHLGNAYYRITNKNSGKVMDVSGPSTADGANIHQWTWSGGDNQQWRVEDVGGGNYRLVAKHSGKVADVAGSGTTDGTNIHQWTWNAGNAQKFKLESVPVPVSNLAGEYRILRKGTDDRAVDLDNAQLVDGANVHLWHTNAGDAQVWNFELQADGYYKIAARASGKVLDVAGPSTADGANIHQWTWNGTDNQRWSVQDLGDGYLRLVAKHSGKVLESSGLTAITDGTNIQQWSWHGGDNQRWRVERVGQPVTNLTGGYNILSKDNGNAVDVTSGGTADGVNIQMWTPNGSVAQQFSFVHLGTGHYRINCVVSGKVIDVAGPSAANGANIHQHSWLNGQNQVWRVELMEDGYYRFLSQFSGKAMDAQSTAQGGNVHQWAWHGGPNQLWSLAPVSTPPAAPSGLTASGVSQTQINLSWTDNSADEANFVVGRSATSGGPYTDVATLGANVTSWSNTGLAANSTWYYVVRAVGAAGSSANSAQAGGVTWPSDIIVDNAEAAFTASGNWSTGTSAADKYGTNYRFRPTAAVADAAVWNVSVPQTRNYLIQAWWAQGTNRSNAAPYILPSGATVTANQQTGGGAWQTLGTQSVSAGARTIQLSCNAPTGFVVLADAVKLIAQ